jgi:hypothetical protein
MNSFELYENSLTESDFRSSHDDIQEETQRCCAGMGGENRCKEKCHFLLSVDFEATAKTGFPPIFGLDCDVEFLCWGGDDVNNSTIETYCKNCADIRRGFYLNQEREDQHAKQIEQRRTLSDEREKRKLRCYWVQLSPIELEQQCAQLFRDLGFQAETTPITNDGGIDILLCKNGKDGAAQCKARTQPCGVKEIREFYGTICAENMSFGYFISRSGFTPRAKLLLEKMLIVRGWDVENLIESASENI